MARPVDLEHLVAAVGEGASTLARDRLSAILASCAGVEGVHEAAASLGISPQHFHSLRARILAGALSAAEPRPLGRPAAAEDPELAALRAENAQLQRRLADEKIYREIAALRDEMIAAGMGRKLKGLKKKRLRS